MIYNYLLFLLNLKERIIYQNYEVFLYVIIWQLHAAQPLLLQL
jgi:hypothetical protein